MEYLIFIKKEEATQDGKFIYRFDFSTDVESAWGDNWNICPTAIVPGISPDINLVSSSYRVIGERSFYTMPENTCFSMQDCIDGIVAIAYTDIMEDDMVKFYFGNDKGEVLSVLEERGFLIEEQHLENNEGELIDALIEKYGGDE